MTYKSANTLIDPSSMSKAIMLLYSSLEFYNDVDLYHFSTFYLHENKNCDTFMTMEPE